MAIHFYTGFEGLNNATDLLLGPLNSFTYVNQSGASDNPGCSIILTTTNARGGSGNAVTFTSSGTGSGQSWHFTAFKGYLSTLTTAIFGSAVIFPTSSVAGSIFPTIGLANGGVPQLSVRMDNTGTVTVWRGRPNSGNGTLLGTSGTTLSPTVYNYLEVEATIGTGTSGSVTVRANGVAMPGLTLTGINTSADSTTNVTQGFIGFYATGGSMQTGINFCTFDDMVGLDTTGSAPYNTFLGDVHVQYTTTTGAGASSQWTPLAGSNWSEVNETAMDGDTTYNSSGTNGQIDLFTQGGLTVTPATIFAVKVRLAARLDAAGGDTVAGELRSGGTNYVSATPLGPLSSYSYLDFVWTADPNTAAAWTASGVNALQVGYNRVT